MVVRRWVAFALGWLSVLCALPAQAFPSARLVYVRGQGAEGCPSEIELRLSVAHRLGYDPFHTGSRRTIMAVVEQSGERLTARMELVDEQGVSQGERRLEAAPDRCDDLIRALSLSMSIAIDPERTEPAPDASPNLALTPAPRSTERSDDAPAEPVSQPKDSRAAPLFLRFGLGAQAALGVAPATAFGLLVVAGGRYRDASLAFEFRLDAPASRAVGSGESVESRIVAGAIAPCLHYDPGFFCGLGLLGAVAATSDAAARREDSEAFAAAGIRVGTEWRISNPFVLRTHADLLANLTRFDVELDGSSVWKMPAISGSLGVTLLGSFP